MEVAAALTDKAHSVSVVGMESVPFKKALGEKVGKAIMKVGVKRQEALVAWGLKSRNDASQACSAHEHPNSLFFAVVWGQQSEVLHDERGVGDDWPSWTGILKVRATAWHDVRQHNAPPPTNPGYPHCQCRGLVRNQQEFKLHCTQSEGCHF